MLDVLEFLLDGVRYGLPSERVVEVVPRVILTPLPATAVYVLGVFRHRGEVAVAIELRRRLGHPARPPSMSDHFIVARGARRRVALCVDRAVGLVSLPLERLRPAPVRAPHIAGIAELEDGLLLIEDLDAALSLDDERAIDAGLGAVEAPA